jgi:hypothetical protein
MKKLFYIGLIALGLFEILNVYFIMPMPGSQQFDTINIAYFLYSYRWFFRTAFVLLILAGAFSAFSISKKWIPLIALLPVVAILYVFNFQMTADHMFLQPESLVFKSRAENNLSDSSIVISVTNEGESKAYPVRYIQYHHQVRDSIGGKPVMVTYCNVCRTGRVFEPLVNGKPENFRLVGMDHFNAMFEDETTKSWWRQATGEAITGSLKANVLLEVESTQLTLSKFFALYPFGKVMQAEDASKQRYDTLGRFEKGKSKGKLTKRDSLSWKDKSWVLGIQLDGKSKAYDWIDVKQIKIVNDQLGDTPIVIVLASDEESFAAFKRENNDPLILRNDSLTSANKQYDLHGRARDGSKLERVTAYQEFWHSWREFHPDTEVYK